MLLSSRMSIETNWLEPYAVLLKARLPPSLAAVAETPVDVALGSEAARDAVAYTPGGTGVCTVDHTFPAGVGTGAITEVGLFDDPAAGNMFNRKTFPAINKTAGDALKASCTITLIAA